MSFCRFCSFSSEYCGIVTLVGMMTSQSSFNYVSFHAVVNFCAISLKPFGAGFFHLCHKRNSDNHFARTCLCLYSINWSDFSTAFLIVALTCPRLFLLDDFLCHPLIASFFK